ncbi:MAG: ATPase, partial [Flavobacteriaceae bacterium]|nr:ATPase [Flavobacteriaceae bacterium]
EKAEAVKAKEEEKIAKEKEEKKSRSRSTSSRRSTRQNPVVKVLTSATFIRAVFGILKKVM